jgi:hypothetical protein
MQNSRRVSKPVVRPVYPQDFFWGLQTRYIVQPFSCAAGEHSSSCKGQPPHSRMPPLRERCCRAFERLCEKHGERHSSVALARDMSDSGESVHVLKWFSHRLSMDGTFRMNSKSWLAALLGFKYFSKFVARTMKDTNGEVGEWSETSPAVGGTKPP